VGIKIQSFPREMCGEPESWHDPIERRFSHVAFRLDPVEDGGVFLQTAGTAAEPASQKSSIPMKPPVGRVCTSRFLPRIALRSDFDHASRANGGWSDPARVVRNSPRAGPLRN